MSLPSAPDVIVCWPRVCDYPAWRAWITQHRDNFSDVFVAFTELAGRDISDFVRANFPDVTFCETFAHTRDWRDAAVNAALDRAQADRVWFTEQDFVYHGNPKSFFMRQGPIVGFDAGDGRPLHPACIVVDRKLVDRTSRYFGPVPRDHFHTFGLELTRMAPPILLAAGYRHFQAISESQMLVGLGERPRFRPEQFREWLADNLSAGVALEPEWERLMREWAEKQAPASAS